MKQHFHQRTMVLTRGQSLLIGLSASIAMLVAGWWVVLRELRIDAALLRVAPVAPPSISERHTRLSSRVGIDLPKPPGTLLPEIEAAGWLNGPAVARADLGGKVVVLDLWYHL